MSDENFHFQVGALNCIALQDSVGLGGEATSFFANAPAGELAAECRRHGVVGQVMLALACLLVDTGTQLILVDTGAGPSDDPALGRLGERLQAEGIAPENVDTVILTHWHWDHVWGNTRADGSLTFPHARFVVGRTEWDWATAEANRQALQDVGGERSRNNLLAVAGRLLFVDEETEIVPGVRAIAAPGHTAGHLALLLSSEGEQLLCIGDVVHHPIHVEHPEWHTDFDFAAAQTVATRRALFTRAANEGMLVFAPHLPPMGVGHIAAAGDGWRWEPAE